MAHSGALAPAPSRLRARLFHIKLISTLGRLRVGAVGAPGENLLLCSLGISQFTPTAKLGFFLVSSAIQIKPCQSGLGTGWVTHRENRRDGPYFVLSLLLFCVLCGVIFKRLIFPNSGC